VLDDGLENHPAVLAWRAVEPEGSLPERIEVFSDSANWLLYALNGAGPSGSTVFAKRRSRSLAGAERAVYERILPHLPIAAPRCYGCTEDGDFIWLLLEAVEGAPYDESNPGHLAMAGRCVATLHTAAAAFVHSTPLSDAGPDRYLAHLVSGRERLERCLQTSRAVDSNNRLDLEHTIELLNRIEACWYSIRARCQEAPTTLVHCDFRPKNVFVRPDGAGLVTFDWELAGWGPPAADLTKIDVAAYWSEVRESWKAVTFETVLAWAGVGQLFQTLAAIDWKGTELTIDTTEALAIPLVSLKLLGARLADVSAFI
jgi:aminoglycoside phosphotransferase (APT) family kinase protein